MDSNELMGCFKTPLLAKSMTGGINAIVLVGGNDTPLKFYTQHWEKLAKKNWKF